MLTMIRLGILDLSPVRSGGSPAEALAETVRLAQAAEALGYHRFWLAEHHGATGFAGSCPEVLIAAIAAATRSIRVGSGGVLLRHYSPLKVVETFRTLEALYPGRIELGLGRAPGCDEQTAAALSGGVGEDVFEPRLRSLLAYLEDVEEDPEAVRAVPVVDGGPPVWLLGSGTRSAAYAAYFGCAFAFAHFLAGDAGVQVVRMYAERYRPSSRAPEPQACLAVAALCAESDRDAERLSASARLWFARTDGKFTAPDRGVDGRMPSLDEALAHRFTPEEQAKVAAVGDRWIAGSPARVRDRLLELAERAGVENVLVLTLCPDFEARLRSYELLAKALAPVAAH